MKLNISASPHIRDPKTTQQIMLDVVIALLPALIASAIIFGFRAVILTAVAVASCVVFEYISRIVMKRQNTIQDLSAVVTGILLAYNVPASLPIWMLILGSFVAIVIVKQMFGGIGHNFANPAIAARIILTVSFPAEMTDFAVLGRFATGADVASTTDLVSSATPMALQRADACDLSYLNLFLGGKAGTIGEVCILALLIGLAYLLWREIIDLYIPVSFVATTLLFTLLTGHNPIFHFLSGGLVLGAVFMATDYVTSPITAKGKIIFGIGCGLLTGLIRVYGSSTEGVSYAILLMNILTPQINEWTRHRTTGKVEMRTKTVKHTASGGDE